MHVANFEQRLPVARTVHCALNTSQVRVIDELVDKMDNGCADRNSLVPQIVRCAKTLWLRNDKLKLIGLVAGFLEKVKILRNTQRQLSRKFGTCLHSAPILKIVSSGTGTGLMGAPGLQVASREMRR